MSELVERLRARPHTSDDYGEDMIRAANLIERQVGLLEEARKELRGDAVTMEVQISRCKQWGKSHRELDAALKDIRTTLAKLEEE